MTSATRIRDILVAQRVVPVLRLGSTANTIRAVDCLREAGFSTFEITLTTPGAVELIAELHARLGATATVGPAPSPTSTPRGAASTRARSSSCRRASYPGSQPSRTKRGRRADWRFTPTEILPPTARAPTS